MKYIIFYILLFVVFVVNKSQLLGFGIYVYIIYKKKKYLANFDAQPQGNNDSDFSEFVKLGHMIFHLISWLILLIISVDV